MLLPFPANCFQLKSFWLVMSLIIGLIGGYFLNIHFSIGWFLLGIIIGFAFALPGLIRPQIATIPYRAFNKLVRGLIRFTNECFLLVCFFVIYIAGGKNGTCFKMARPNESKSLWVSICPDSTGVYDRNNGTSLMEFTHRSWFYPLVRWIIKSGNWWMCCLLPYMILLSIFKKEKVTTTPSDNVYTLY